MGLFDFLKRRRERESAIQGAGLTDPSQQVQAMSAGGQLQPQQPAAGAGPQAGGFDLAQLGQIGAMIAEAAKSQNIQVHQGEPRTIDLHGSGLREEILQIMSQHGIDADPASGQQIDANQIPGMQQEILDALSNAGLDMGALDGASDIQIDSTGGGFDGDAGGGTSGD